MGVKFQQLGSKARTKAKGCYTRNNNTKAILFVHGTTEQMQMSPMPGMHKRIWCNTPSQLANQTVPIPHAINHIPKTGLTYGWKVFRQLLPNNVLWTKLNTTRASTTCQQAVNMVAAPNTFCKVWMREDSSGLLTRLADNAYIILREPRQHVLSQFFHCKESEVR